MNSQEPLFSLLVANYNNGRYIERAIESVKSQTYKNWEIVIVDDASTDDSLAIIQPFLSDRILLFKSAANGGCGSTKRRCVEEAKGELCAFLDPDDAITSDALEVMVQAHLRSPESSLIYSNHYECDGDLNIVKESTRVKAIPSDCDYLTSSKVSVHHIASFKRSLYMKTSGISQVYKKAVDQDLYYKLEEVGSLQYVDKCLYYYRIHQGGISTGKNIKSAFEVHMAVMDEVFMRRLNSNYPAFKGFSRLWYQFQYWKFRFWVKPKARFFISLRSN